MPSGSNRTAPTLPAYVAALGRCLRHIPDLTAALSPVGWPSPAARLALEADLADAHGAGHTAARKRDWLAFIGHGDATSQRRLIADLADVDPEPRVAARRAAIAASVAVSAEIDHAIAVLTSPTTPRRPIAQLAAATTILVTGGVARLSSSAAAAGARWLHEHAPPLPPVERFAHRPTNLLTELVAESLPSLLASAPVRFAVHHLPNPVVVGIRSGRLATTVSVGSDVIRVRNGISRHVTVLLHGGAEPFLRRAAVRLEAEAAGLETH